MEIKNRVANCEGAIGDLYQKNQDLSKDQKDTLTTINLGLSQHEGRIRTLEINPNQDCATLTTSGLGGAIFGGFTWLGIAATPVAAGAAAAPILVPVICGTIMGVVITYGACKVGQAVAGVFRHNSRK